MALLVARRIRSTDVLAILAELFVLHGPPAHIRSDNPVLSARPTGGRTGPRVRCHRRERLAGTKIGVQTLYITPGSPWENGYRESFNSSMRDEPLNGETFYCLAEAQILIEA
jgi:putative transposase